VLKDRRLNFCGIDITVLTAGIQPNGDAVDYAYSTTTDGPTATSPPACAESALTIGADYRR